MQEIDAYLMIKMLLKAQKVKLRISDGDKDQIISKFWDIGKAFKYDDSIECAVKINQIITDSFDEEGIFSIYCENKIMKKLKLKHIETENKDKDVGSIARMVVKRKCDLAKVINKRVHSPHQQKVLLKISPRALVYGTNLSYYISVLQPGEMDRFVLTSAWNSDIYQKMKGVKVCSIYP